MKKSLITLLLTVIVVTAIAQKVDPITVNFGTIPMRPKSERTFTVHNRGSKPMVIMQIDIDCNCTKIAWKKAPIRAGDSTLVTVTYTPDTQGVFYKTARMKTSDSDTKIIIRGTVK